MTHTNHAFIEYMLEKKRIQQHVASVSSVSLQPKSTVQLVDATAATAATAESASRDDMATELSG